MRRRTYVAMVGAGVLGGCSSFDSGEGTDAVETDTPTENADTAAFQHQWEADLEDVETLELSDFHATCDAETAYLGTHSELTALSLADGTEQWTLSLDTALDGVTIDDDGLYTLQDRTVQAIDPATGEPRWAESAGGGQRAGTNDGTVATTDDHVAASGAGGVIVFEKETGRQTAHLTENWGDPVRAWNGGFVVADNAVTAYDPDGTARWTVDNDSLTWSAPVTGSTLVFGGDETIVGIDLDSGDRSWATDADTELTEPMTAATDDTVFVYPQWRADTVYALDAETGEARWTLEDADSTPFPPVVLDSAVVVPDGLGAQAREPTTGEQLASTDAFGHQYGATGTGRTVVVYDTQAVAYRL